MRTQIVKRAALLLGLIALLGACGGEYPGDEYLDDEIASAEQELAIDPMPEKSKTKSDLEKEGYSCGKVTVCYWTCTKGSSEYTCDCTQCEQTKSIVAPTFPRPTLPSQPTQIAR